MGAIFSGMAKTIFDVRAACDGTSDLLEEVGTSTGTIAFHEVPSELSRTFF
jgi:hypothetical protein